MDFSQYVQAFQKHQNTFFACIKAQRGWSGNILYFEEDPYVSYLVGTSSFINILDSCLEKSPTRMVRLFVIYQTAWTLWLHNKEYQHCQPRFAPWINVELSIAHLVLVYKYTTSHKCRRQMKYMVILITPSTRA